MYYSRSITILSDGKTVTAIDNKTGRQAISRSLPPYKDLNDFEFVHKAASAIESLIENQEKDNDEIKVCDIVSFNDNFDTRYVYPYDVGFVYSLSIENTDKIRYCYSLSNPPINMEYFVLAKSGNKAYIQTLTARFRCYVVDTKILKKVSK